MQKKSRQNQETIKEKLRENQGEIKRNQGKIKRQQ